MLGYVFLMLSFKCSLESYFSVFVLCATGWALCCLRLKSRLCNDGVKTQIRHLKYAAKSSSWKLKWTRAIQRHIREQLEARKLLFSKRNGGNWPLVLNWKTYGLSVVCWSFWTFIAYWNIFWRELHVTFLARWVHLHLNLVNCLDCMCVRSWTKSRYCCEFVFFFLFFDVLLSTRTKRVLI